MPEDMPEEVAVEAQPAEAQPEGYREGQDPTVPDSPPKGTLEAGDIVTAFIVIVRANGTIDVATKFGMPMQREATPEQIRSACLMASDQVQAAQIQRAMTKAFSEAQDRALRQQLQSRNPSIGGRGRL